MLYYYVSVHVMLYKFVVCIEALVWSGGLATKEYVYIILISVF